MSPWPPSLMLQVVRARGWSFRCVPNSFQSSGSESVCLPLALAVTAAVRVTGTHQLERNFHSMGELETPIVWVIFTHTMGKSESPILCQWVVHFVHTMGEFTQELIVLCAALTHTMGEITTVPIVWAKLIHSMDAGLPIVCATDSSHSMGHVIAHSMGTWNRP